MNRYKQLLGEEWNIVSAGGLTDEAYIAENKETRLFLKRNSSPFLAVLSAEGLVPKLIWTKRMENGDVITAQQWLEGRSFNPNEMISETIIKLLSKIHHSKELLNLLKQMGKQSYSPKEHLFKLEEQINNQQLHMKYSTVRKTLEQLKESVFKLCEEEQVVCHGDLNHNNFIKTVDEQIYLIDWDNTKISDPASDIGLILNYYIPKTDWRNWLKIYGLVLKQSFLDRMYWYLKMDILSYALWYDLNQKPKQTQICVEELEILKESLVDEDCLS